MLQLQQTRAHAEELYKKEAVSDVVARERRVGPRLCAGCSRARKNTTRRGTLCRPCWVLRLNQISRADVDSHGTCLEELSGAALCLDTQSLAELNLESSSDNLYGDAVFSPDEDYTEDEEDGDLPEVIGSLFATEQEEPLNEGGTKPLTRPVVTPTLQVLTSWDVAGRRAAVTTLVDTGSTSSLITRELVESISTRSQDPIKIYPTSASMRTATGDVLRAMGMAMVAFRLGETACQHTFFVFESLPFSVILGMDFIMTNKIIIDPDEGLVHRYKDEVYTPLLDNTAVHEVMMITQALGHKERLLLITDSLQTFRPGQTIEIRVPFARTAYAFRATMGIVHPRMETKGLTVAKGLVRCDNGMALIQVINSTDEWLALPKDSLVGKFEIVEQTEIDAWWKRDTLDELRQSARRDLTQQFEEWLPYGQQCMSLITEHDWDHPSYEEHLSAPVERVVCDPDPLTDATKEEVFSALQATYGQFDAAKVDKKPFKQRRLMAKAIRLLDRLVLFQEEETKDEIGVLPPTLDLEEGYDHLTPTEKACVVKHVSRVARFFMQGKYPTTIRTRRPVVIDTKDAVPVTSGYRRLTHAEQKIVDDYVDKLITADVVEPCSGPWSSPVLLVPKADGSLRPVADLRKVNTLVAKDCYPMPNVDECLDQLEGAKWFTKLDLSSAFWQLPLAERSRDCTAFMSRARGLLRWKTMPMGYVNASACFQREIDGALGSLRLTCCVAYIDDVIVYSDSTLEDHMAKVEAVLKALALVGFSGNPQKCKFAQRDLIFLGHYIKAGKISPRKDRLEKLMSASKPTSITQLKSFLGFAGYYRKFISHYSEISAPLTELTKMAASGKQGKMLAKLPWKEGEWTERHDNAFRAIKGAFLNNPTLALPQADRAWRLATDASGTAMGAVLSQVDNNGKEFPIAFLSRKLQPPEVKWDIWEKELAAIVWATTTCRHYLAGHRFELITDSSVAAAVVKQQVPTNRRNWVVRLSQFDFYITHRKGELNRNADFFSRYTFDAVEAYDEWERTQQKKLEFEPLQFNNISIEGADVSMVDNNKLKEYIMEQQSADESTNYWIRWLQIAHDEPDREGMPNMTAYKMVNGLLVRERTFKSWTQHHQETVTKHLIVIPKGAIQTILYMFHGDGSVLGHLGRHKTFQALTKRFFWKGMSADVRRWLGSCHKCIRLKKAPPKHRRYNVHMGQTAPMNRIAIDIVGPLTKTATGYTYILTVYCPFSHWPEAYPLRSTTAEEVIKALKYHISRHGISNEVLSDRGSNFLSETMRGFLARIGSRKLTTSAYKPSSNGSVENFHKYLAKSIATLINKNHTDWDEHLPHVLFAYRVSPLDGSDLSPFDILYGRHPNLPVDALVARESEETKDWTVDDHVERMYEQQSIVNPLIAEVRLDRFKQNQKRNVGIVNPQFATGSTVFVSFPKGKLRPKGGTTKFSDKNRGPYEVVGPVDKHRLVYALRHKLTGEVNHFYAGRLISAAEWVNRDAPKKKNQPSERRDDLLPETLQREEQLYEQKENALAAPPVVAQAVAADDVRLVDTRVGIPMGIALENQAMTSSVSGGQPETVTSSSGVIPGGGVSDTRGGPSNPTINTRRKKGTRRPKKKPSSTTMVATSEQLAREDKTLVVVEQDISEEDPYVEAVLGVYPQSATKDAVDLAAHDPDLMADIEKNAEYPKMEGASPLLNVSRRKFSTERAVGVDRVEPLDDMTGKLVRGRTLTSSHKATKPRIKRKPADEEGQETSYRRVYKTTADQRRRKT